MSTGEAGQPQNPVGEEPQQEKDVPVNLVLPVPPVNLLGGGVAASGVRGNQPMGEVSAHGASNSSALLQPSHGRPSSTNANVAPQDPRQPAKPLPRLSGTTLLTKIQQYQSNPAMMAKISPLLAKFPLETDWAVIDDHLRREAQQKKLHDEARAAEQKAKESTHAFQVSGVSNRPAVGQTRNINDVGDIYDPSAKRRRMELLSEQANQAQLTQRWLQQQATAVQLQQRQMEEEAERLRRQHQLFAQQMQANERMLQDQAIQLRQQQQTMRSESDAGHGATSTPLAAPSFVSTLQSSLPSNVAGASSLSAALPSTVDPGQAQLVDRYIADRDFQQQVFGAGGQKPTVLMVGSASAGKTGIVDKILARQPFKIREVIIEVAPKSRRSAGLNLKKSLGTTGDASAIGQESLAFLLRRAMDRVLIIRNEVVMNEFEKAPDSATTRALLKENRDLLAFSQEVAFLGERYTSASVLSFVDEVFEKIWGIVPQEGVSFAAVPANLGIHCLVPLMTNPFSVKQQPTSSNSSRKSRARHHGACFRHNDGECQDIAAGSKCSFGYRHVCSSCGKPGHRRAACGESAKSKSEE